MGINERTGWRDEAFSKRHRFYGKKLGLVNIDGVWCFSAGNGLPKALVEFKNENAEPLSRESYEFKVLFNLAQKSELPAFIIRYKSNFSEYMVTPINGKAKIILDKRTIFTELEYVKFEYRARGLMPPSDTSICAEIGWNLSAIESNATALAGWKV